MKDITYSFTQDQLETTSLGGSVSVLMGSEHIDLYGRKVKLHIGRDELSTLDEEEFNYYDIKLFPVRAIVNVDKTGTTVQIECNLYDSSQQHNPFTFDWIGIVFDSNDPNVKTLLSDEPGDVFLTIAVSDKQIGFT